MGFASHSIILSLSFAPKGPADALAGPTFPSSNIFFERLLTLLRNGSSLALQSFLKKWKEMACFKPFDTVAGNEKIGELWRIALFCTHPRIRVLEKSFPQERQGCKKSARCYGMRSFELISISVFQSNYSIEALSESLEIQPKRASSSCGSRFHGRCYEVDGMICAHVQCAKKKRSMERL